MFSEISHKSHYNKVFSLSEFFIGSAAVLIILLMGFASDKAGVVIVFYSSAILALVATIPVLLLSKDAKKYPTSEVEIY